MSDVFSILQMERVSAQTRRVLEERMNAEPRTQRFLSEDQFVLLQQIVDALLPQSVAKTEVAIADAIDARLMDGDGSGWRYADLPADGEAYQRGLDAFAMLLRGMPVGEFAQLSDEGREGFLRCVQMGEVDAFARFPMKRWMEMVRVDAVTVWLSHPRTMAAIGFDGFADGEDGWTELGLDSERAR